MSTTTAKGSGPKVNDGGTVLHAGTTDSVVTNAPWLDYIVSSKPGAAVTSGVPQGMLPAVSNGEFGKLRQDKYIVLGATTELAGLSNDTLRTTGADWGRRSIHFSEANYTLHMVSSGGWSYATGQLILPASGVGAVSNDSFGTDEAARPTRAIPGELAIMETGKTATLKDYDSI